MSDQRFDGQVALVTGGSSGIGAASPVVLAEGARVASLDLAEHAPEGVLGLAGDVSSSADVEAAVARVTSELGPVDILVCSAGITGGSLRTVDVDDDEWRRVFAINSDGIFFCNRAVVGDGRARLRADRERRLDRRQGRQPDGAAYSASKASVIAFTKALGKDLAGTGVLVNASLPR